MSTAFDTPEDAAARVFKDNSARVLATLIRHFGDFDLAEDILQDAIIRALEVWPQSGVPDNPAAWLFTTARNKGIDRLRRRQNFQSKQPELREHWSTRTEVEAMDERMFYPDDQLRLIFTACHPALSLEARVALTLRSLAGLSTREIARSFLVPEPTMAQRLVRAKKKIRLAGIPYEVPAPDRLSERLDGVLTVVYLIFNEGYTATEGERLTRPDLTNEAIRLGKLIIGLVPQSAEALGLTALMLLHDARSPARLSPSGELVTLEEQDRSLWKGEQIIEGTKRLDEAMSLKAPGAYQLQAAISALHCQAPEASQTDWRQIALLYGRLYEILPSPVVALNGAAAIGMAEGPRVGLARIQALSAAGVFDELREYYLLHAARADLLRRAADSGAEAAYREALALVRNDTERVYLERRLREIAE